jgi:hypothetical protein
MANRYQTDDQSKWFGPTHIGPAPAHDPTNGGKRITKFIFDGPAESPIPKLRESYETAIKVVEGLRTKRREAEATGRLTRIGVTENLAQGAMVDQIPKLRRARATVEKVKGEIAERAAALKLPKPSEEQHREHAEIRSAMRSLTPEQRAAFLRQNRQDPVVALAIASAIPALSGVDAVTHQNVADEQTERLFADQLAELRDLEEAASIVERVTNLAREEIREIIDCTPETFEKFAAVGEHRDGELPMLTETRVIDGKQVDVCRVYDMAAKEWRDGTAEEVGRAA